MQGVDGLAQFALVALALLLVVGLMPAGLAMQGLGDEGVPGFQETLGEFSHGGFLVGSLDAQGWHSGSVWALRVQCAWGWPAGVKPAPSVSQTEALPLSYGHTQTH